MQKISVIIPLFNAENTIIDALNSVKSQTYGSHNFEVIVINDGSTDHSRDRVEKYISENQNVEIQLINQKNAGVSAARNVGLKICRGELIALLDADDVWFPDKIYRQVSFLNSSSLKIDFISCRRTNHKIAFPYFVDDRNLADVTFKKLLIRNEIASPTVLFKRKILNNSGFFDENQRYAEDHNYWLKISKKNKMFILNEELVIAGGGKRTFGISGLSANLIEMEIGFQKNLKEMWAFKRINFAEYGLYYLLYRAKYYFRLLRNLK